MALCLQNKFGFPIILFVHKFATQQTSLGCSFPPVCCTFVRVLVSLPVSYNLIYLRRLSAPCLPNNYGQRKQDTSCLPFLTMPFLRAFGFLKNIYGPSRRKNALLSRTVFCRGLNPISGNLCKKLMSLNE